MTKLPYLRNKKPWWQNFTNAKSPIREVLQEQVFSKSCHHQNWLILPHPLILAFWRIWRKLPQFWVNFHCCGKYSPIGNFLVINYHFLGSNPPKICWLSSFLWMLCFWKRFVFESCVNVFDQPWYSINRLPSLTPVSSGAVFVSEATWWEIMLNWLMLEECWPPTPRPSNIGKHLMLMWRKDWPRSRREQASSFSIKSTPECKIKNVTLFT